MLTYKIILIQFLISINCLLTFLSTEEKEEINPKPSLIIVPDLILFIWKNCFSLPCITCYSFGFCKGACVVLLKKCSLFRETAKVVQVEENCQAARFFCALAKSEEERMKCIISRKNKRPIKCKDIVYNYYNVNFN